MSPSEALRQIEVVEVGRTRSVAPRPAVANKALRTGMRSPMSVIRFLRAFLLPSLLATAAILSSAQAAPAARLSPLDLRCEYLEYPMGIDIVKPRLSWRLSPGPRGRMQTAYRIRVAGSAQQLRSGKPALWDSGVVRSSESRFIPYAGKPLTSGQLCYWDVEVWDNQGARGRSDGSNLWSMGLLSPADWTARWIGLKHGTSDPVGTPLPFPWLRKTVELPSKPARATAFINVLGYFELYINGKKVSEDVLCPTVSDFSKRSLYVTYDVGSYLKPGKNTLALWLGRGWYVRGHEGVMHDGPLARVQINCVGADGAAQQLATDSTWKVQASSLYPLGRGLAFGDYGGERWDSRREQPNWAQPDYDDSSWAAASEFQPAAVPAVAQMVEPNRIVETIRTRTVEARPDGTFLLDLGTNFTGWLQLRVAEPVADGAVVKLEYADAIMDSGRLAIHNQRDEIIGSGKPITFRSRFNYHGFRWVRITGLKQQPAPSDATGYFIHTNYEPAGSFESSNPLLNRIYRMTTWTYRALTLGGYVVDCPTRERLGYGGDAGTSLETGMYNFSAGGLYNRWMGDWRVAQAPNGDLPFTAPHYQDRGGGGPMWSGFVVTLPWQSYIHYGDRGMLETMYPTMKKWLAYLKSEASTGLIEQHNCFAMRLTQWRYLGDWVPPRPIGGVPGSFGDPESVRFINNTHYLYQLMLAAKVARILGKPAEGRQYDAEGLALSRAIHNRFFKRDTVSYATGEQPYLAFPLFLDSAPVDIRDALAKNLEQTIRMKNDGHIDAGMHGAYFLMKYLIKAGRHDLLFEMVNKETYPSWGYMLANGATTAWEDWRGRQSHIHDTLISIGAWFIQGPGGIQIDPESPGFKHFFLRPALVGDLTFVKSHHDSPYGKIVSNWRKSAGQTTFEVTVPPNSTATLELPASNASEIQEGGKPASRAAGVSVKRGRAGVVELGLQPGSYQFRVETGK